MKKTSQSLIRIKIGPLPKQTQKASKSVKRHQYGFKYPGSKPIGSVAHSIVRRPINPGSLIIKFKISQNSRQKFIQENLNTRLCCRN